jgi:putative ABC transport system permease protein
LNKNKIQEGLTQIEKLFKEINPTQTFKYSFLSDEINTLYLKEKRLSTIYMLFTIIALIISGIGLFTIALYDTRRRIKEIGIRKVNGATSTEIVIMLNKDFIKWVIIAFFIATPIALYTMSNWLQNFAYKTALSWWIFALAGLFTILISLLTVSWQSYNAAKNNPVESLRDD